MTKGFLKGLLIFCLLLQGCQQAGKVEPEPENSKLDLKKAALFNMQLGLGYLKQGDRPRAKRKLLTAVKQAPESPDVNAALAYYFEQTSELAQATKYYQKAIDLSDNSGAQLNNYGTFLCRQADYKKAEQYFLKAVKDQNYLHTAGAYENAGLCALQVPDETKASFYFKEAIKQDPSRRESLYELVKLESKMGHNKQALEVLQNHSEVVLSDKILLTLAKEIAGQEGKMDLALEYENTAKKLEPSIENSGANNDYNSHNG